MVPEAVIAGAGLGDIAVIIVCLGFFVGGGVKSWAFRKRTGVQPITFDRHPSEAHNYVGVLFMAHIILWIAISVVWWTPWRATIFPSSGLFVDGTSRYAVLEILALAFSIIGSLVTWAGWKALGDSWRIGVDPERTELRTGGVYKFSRNPIFAGMLMMVAAIVCARPCATAVVMWYFTYAVIKIQVLQEEEHLLGLHGQAYADFTAKVGRFIPGLGIIKNGD